MSILSEINKIFIDVRRKAEKQIIHDMVGMTDYKIVNNVYTGGNKILIVISEMVKNSGGHTSILRIGTQLAKYGYDVTYLSLGNQSVKKMDKIAKENLNDYQGKFVRSECNQIFDVVMATSSNTVPYVLKMHGYKLYFVQDYEPIFFPWGDRFFTAKYTYEMGMHMISLGAWNKKMIEQQSKSKNLKIDVLSFPYEPKEYIYKKRNYMAYKQKKKLKIAVYLKNAGRRLPSIVPEMLSFLKREFEKDEINLEISYFGENKRVKYSGGINLGKLSKDALMHLYQESDFGMCFSLSNISLVPYEMIATGLPIIELEDGSFKDFFGDKAAILTDISYKNLYFKMKEYINYPHKIEQMMKNAMHNLETVSWDKTGYELVQILENVKKNES